MTMLTIDQLLSLSVPQEVVEIPERGGSVRLKGLTRPEFMAIQAKSKEGDAAGENERLEKLLLVASLVEPTITDAQAEEVYVGAFGPVNRIMAAILKINGLDAKAVKEAEKSPAPGPDAEVRIPAGGEVGENSPAA